MLVQLNVSVKNLIESFLAAHINHIIVLGVQVNNAQLSCLLSQGAYAEGLIFPPRLAETVGVPFRVRHDWRNVKVAAQRTMPPEQVCLWVNRSFWLRYTQLKLQGCLTSWVMGSNQLVISVPATFSIGVQSSPNCSRLSANNLVKSYTPWKKLTQQSSPVQCWATSSGV